MNRQSGSLAPIPVTPRNAHSTQQQQQPLPLFPTPPNSKRKSKEGRRSWLFPNKPRNSPIWRPSTGHSPPTPQWPLPRQPITQLPPQPQQSEKPVRLSHDEGPNPAFTRTYTRPREAPLPPPPTASQSRRSSSSSSSSSSTTPTLTDDTPVSPRTRGPSSTTNTNNNALPPHPLSPRFPPPSPPRPPPSFQHQRNASFQTRYMNMAMSTERIPRIHNILSNVFAWMILLAFILAPANFCGQAHDDGDDADANDAHRTSTMSVVSSYHHHRPIIPSTALLAASCTIFGLGSFGMLWLALCWRRNYIWLMNRIYLPLMLNSLAGLIGSLVIVDIQNHMWFSVAAYVSLGIEGATLLLSGVLFFYTHYLLLGKLKREHVRETSTKRVVDLVKAGKRPPFAPGSVV